MPTPNVRVWKQKVGSIFFHQYGIAGSQVWGDIVFPLGGTREEMFLPVGFILGHYDLVREAEDGDMEGRGPDGEPLPARDYPRRRPRVPVARHSGDPA